MTFINKLVYPLYTLYPEKGCHGIKHSDLLLALSPFSGNQTLGHECRGEHWTDKRFSIESGVQFEGKYPKCSVSYLMSPRARSAANKAVAGRTKATTYLSTNAYVRGLIIRCIKFQIRNVDLRVDWFLHKAGENLRQFSMSPRRTKRFFRYAAHPINKPAVLSVIDRI